MQVEPTCFVTGTRQPPPQRMNNAVYELLRSDSFVLSEAENLTWHTARMQRPCSTSFFPAKVYI